MCPANCEVTTPPQPHPRTVSKRPSQPVRCWSRLKGHFVSGISAFVRRSGDSLYTSALYAEKAVADP